MCQQVDDVHLVSARLAVAEAEANLAAGTLGILPIVTETPTALFNLSGYANAGPRLLAMTWGAEDLAAAIGASGNRNDTGAWRSPFELARNLCLFAAHAAGVPAIDTVYTNFKQSARLRREADAAAQDGFAGKLAIHPDQVPLINSSFTPNAAQIARAEAVLAALQKSSGGGVASLEGEMIDAPHGKWARNILARARLANETSAR